MKYKKLAMGILLFVNIGYFCHHLFSSNNSQKAQQISVESLSNLAQSYDGRLVVVAVWATWCDACIAEIPMLQKVAEKLRARGVSLAYLTTDGPDAYGSAVKVLSDSGYVGRVFFRKEPEHIFIPSIDAEWSGGLPAFLIFDNNGKRKAFREGLMSQGQLESFITTFL